MSAAAVIRTYISVDGSPLGDHDIKAIAQGYEVSREAVDAYSRAYAAWLRARNDGVCEPLPDEMGLGANRLLHGEKSCAPKTAGCAKRGSL